MQRRPRFFEYLFGLGVLLWLAILGPVAAATAQEMVSARVSSLDTSTFPEVKLFFDLHAADGTFIPGIEKKQVTVYENNIPLAVSELQQLRVGVQFVTAITLGPAFGVRDGSGVSRYEYLVQGLQGWQWKTENQDDLSLLISSGPELIHSDNPADWLQTLAGYQPVARQETPNLQLLNQALDVASDESPQPGMDRVVLFITPPLGTEAAAGLQSIAERARQEGIRINVWLVASPEYGELIQADMLANLASQTAGKFFFFTGTETVPDLESYLEPQRAIYSLGYHSEITSTGAFPVRVEVSLAEASVVTPDKLVQFNIQPPNLVFLAAPVEILRAPAAPSSSRSAMQPTAIPWEESLAPTQQTLQIVVEFPDGRVRELTRSALYVNGVLEAVNTQPPFDEFIWSLEQITQTQQVVLRAEVTDALGLTSSTVDFPVQVTIQVPEQKFLEAPSSRSLILIAASIGIAGLVLGLVLVIGGRIKPHVSGRPEVQRASLSQAPTRPIGQNIPTQPARKKAAARRHADPVTQPVNIPQPAGMRKRWGLPNQLHFPVVSALKRPPSRPASQPCMLFLEPLPVSEEAAPGTPVALVADEIIIGSNAGKATLIINEPSLEEVHAVMVREDSSFRLRDAGSIAGTWINFTPVPEEGALLSHGDILHVGRVGFRFIQRSPGRTRKPSITPYHPTEAL
ncbi:MAG: FHA domain-containing protein [Anaerolineales bacterium]|nr:FHA domain-containing protein [Anaerolineales bacterium]